MCSKVRNQENSVIQINKRVIYYDILNILACIAVVFLHCNGAVHNFRNTRLWKECLVIEVLCYFAVPIFIMISGATLLKYRERYTTKQYFNKRIEKVVIPWLIWSFIVYIVHNKNLNLMNFANKFINGKIETIYWFFPLIIYLYCIIPILSILTDKIEYRKTMWYIVGFIFLFQSLLQPVCKILDINFPSVLNYMVGQNSYIIYLLLGYMLSTSKLSRGKKLGIYVVAIISLLFKYLYTMYVSINTGILNKDSWGYTVFTGVFPAIAVFIFVKDINWEKILDKIKIDTKILTQLASCSFGVYLMHMLVKSKMVNLFNINTSSYFYRLIFPFILYIICVTIVFIIKKIPIVKKIVP